MAPSPTSRIRFCSRATRRSRTSAGTSSRDQLISPRRIPRGRACAHCRDAAFQGLVVYSEGALLRLARLPENERAADLRIITVHAGRELGRHQIAGGEATFGRRMHAVHLLAACAENLEIFRTAARAEKGLHIGSQLTASPGCSTRKRAASAALSMMSRAGFSRSIKANACPSTTVTPATKRRES